MAEENTGELRERINRHLPGGEAVLSLERLPGGLSGITYLASVTGGTRPRRIVVKVAPQGLAPTGNRDVIRQAAVQQFLRSAEAVPVPDVIFTDAGDPPGVPPFYGTSFVEGDSSEPLDEDSSPVPAPAVLRRRYLAASRVLARLHATPTTAPLLAAIPPVSPASELDRWAQAFAAAPEELRFDSDRIRRRLGSSAPEPLPPTLLHGDYRLGNSICADGDVRAVIDWELWGLGDPRADLAWLLHMSDPHLRTARRELPGVPTREEMVDAYCDAAGRRLSGLPWFTALALFKRAAATALIVKYNRRSATPDPVKEKALEVIEPLLTAADAAIKETE